MGVVLDTSLLIAAERHALRLEPLLDSLGDEPVAITAITASELLHGCHRARDTRIRLRRAAFVEALLESLPVLPFALVDARRHAELWADLVANGATIGPHDLQIGATALARGYAVATLNSRDFERLPGVRLVPIEPFLI